MTMPINNETIKINPEFRDLIPPLQPEELTELEKLILAEGCKHPIELWNGFIVDGHNRYAICTKHGLPFSTINKEFESEDHAILWMIRTQLGRRNIDKVDRSRLALRLKPAIKAVAEKNKSQNGGNKKSNDSEKSELQNSVTPINKVNTQKELAKAAQVSHDTISRVEYIDKNADKDTLDKFNKREISINQAYQKTKAKEKGLDLESKKKQITEESKKSVDSNRPEIAVCSYADHATKECDLLITDPPYSTDVDDVFSFARDWLSHVLPTVKPSGRAYICIGAYPVELNAYLAILLNEYQHFTVDNPLIWTYRNALGITPKDKYNLNYQIILHLYQKDTPPLDTSITNEMFSVQDINAPDGRQGNRYHTWQKPDELAMRLVRHGSKTGDVVYDPFCCTGTFLLAAAKQGRKAYGCEISPNNARIAEDRGCHVIY